MSKSILITGASSGIGRASAEIFLDAGWKVGLLARRADKLDQIASGRHNAVVLAADVSDPEAVDAAFDSFQDKAGHLDVVFNNAGRFGPQATIDNVSVEDWRAVVDVNLTGMFLAARAAFSRMRSQSPRGGRIINNGSISAHSPREGSVCYTSTKHAITGVTRSISLDGRIFDIACGQIDIGNANTEMVEDLNSRILARDPDAELMPTMNVDDAARAVFHMASLPLEANVQFMTVLATKMPYIGRG